MTDAAQKPRILSLLGCYWPGNEATGPNQSFEAYANALGDEFDIRVVAKVGVTGMVNEGWHKAGKVQRLLLPARKFGASGLRDVLRNVPYDVLLLNGFHDREFTIPALLMRKLGLIPRKPTVLSPRGEFAGGALSIKSRSKRIYRQMAQRLSLTGDIWMHATADHERNDIHASGLSFKGIVDAPNVRQLTTAQTNAFTREGPVKLVFLGRIAPVKNLDFALNVLSRVSVATQFDIYGPIADTEHWRDCEAAISVLPNHISVRHRGVLDHDALGQTLPEYDALFLPTKGENFGHAINEALSCCLPVLISDQTPWRGLQSANAGWDLPLADPAPFVEAIDSLAKDTVDARLLKRSAARAFAERSFEASDAVDANRHLIKTVLGQST